MSLPKLFFFAFVGRYTFFYYLCPHKNKDNNMRRFLTDWLVLPAVGMAVVLSASCGEEKQQRQQQAADYQTMVVGQKDMVLERQYSARLTGKQIVEVRPQVSGCITRILTGEGEAVKKGQTLFIIDQVPYSAALEVAVAARKSAEARLATAQMNYDNERLLQEGRVVADMSVQTMQNALLEAQAALAQAKAQEVNARNNLSYTEVKSPVSGVASMIPWHVGSLVSSSISEPLVTVADDSEVYVYFSISESQALDLVTQYGSIEKFIAEAPMVSLRMNNGQLYGEQGRISAVSGTVDDKTGAVALRATFPNAGGLLHHGGSGTVVVPTHRKDCIVIPQEATYELQNRMFVYKVVNGKTKATPITLYPQNNGKEYIVDEGLQVGDTIIAEGAGLLKEGIEVKGEK
jgi:membrane fusion protein (multidrug efflux system)